MRDDVTAWAHDAFGTWLGDANLDHEFTSDDLIQVLARDVRTSCPSGGLDARRLQRQWPLRYERPDRCISRLGL